jgi:hypothetical protein
MANIAITLTVANVFGIIFGRQITFCLKKEEDQKLVMRNNCTEAGF